MTNSLQVLIVDAQQRSRSSLTALLRTCPVVGEIQQAASSGQALELIAKGAPDLVIMDLVTCTIDDRLQAIREIKRMYPQTRVIALSLYTEFTLAALVAGADEFISKGEPPLELVRTIEAMAEKTASPACLTCI